MSIHSGKTSTPQQSRSDKNLRFFYASNESDLEAAFGALVRQRAGALLVGNDVFFTNQRQQIVAQARGDFDVLVGRDRRALRMHLGADVAAGLSTLRSALLTALDLAPNRSQ